MKPITNINSQPIQFQFFQFQFQFHEYSQLKLRDSQIYVMLKYYAKNKKHVEPILHNASKLI